MLFFLMILAVGIGVGVHFLRKHRAEKKQTYWENIRKAELEHRLKVYGF